MKYVVRTQTGSEYVFFERDGMDWVQYKDKIFLLINPVQPVSGVSMWLRVKKLNENGEWEKKSIQTAPVVWTQIRLG